jgi:hypothetical protein
MLGDAGLFRRTQKTEPNRLIRSCSLSILDRFFSRKPDTPRIRICSECGMPVGDHKEWCSILRGQATLGRDISEAKEGD